MYTRKEILAVVVVAAIVVRIVTINLIIVTEKLRKPKGTVHMNGSFWFDGLGKKDLFLSSGRLIKANDDISFSF